MANLFYLGKKREKVKGTKSEYRVIKRRYYCLVDGLHDGFVDEELWNKAQEKHKETGVKFASIYGKERANLQTDIIKCPKCGRSMYANRVCWTKKDGTWGNVI